MLAGKPPKEWKHGIFGCFDNPTLCILTFCCPCYIIGVNAQGVGQNCILYGVGFLCGYCLFPPFTWPLVWVLEYIVRMKVRFQYNLEGDTLTDIAFALLCTPCAMAQEAQELQEAGPEAQVMQRQ